MYEDHNLSSLINAINRHREIKELEYISGWEQARYQAFMVVNLFLPQEDKLERFSDLGEFPWEKKESEEKTQNQIKTNADFLAFLKS